MALGGYQVMSDVIVIFHKSKPSEGFLVVVFFLYFVSQGINLLLHEQLTAKLTTIRTHLQKHCCFVVKVIFKCQ